jgi:hypothetical protein
MSYTISDLENLSNKYNLNIHFLKIEDFNKLNKIEDANYIVLIHNKNEDGHFVAFKKIKNNIFYFDSFGQPPFKRLNHYLTKKGMFYYSYVQIQALNENNCGLFCIEFLKEINENTNGNIKKILKKYDEYLHKFHIYNIY